MSEEAKTNNDIEKQEPMKDVNKQTKKNKKNTQTNKKLNKMECVTWSYQLIISEEDGIWVPVRK